MRKFCGSVNKYVIQLLAACLIASLVYKYTLFLLYHINPPSHVGLIVSRCLSVPKLARENLSSHQSATYSNRDKNAISIVLSIFGETNVIRAEAMLKSMLYFHGYLRSHSERCLTPFIRATSICYMKGLSSPLKLRVHLFTDKRSQHLLEQRITNWNLRDVTWITHDTELLMTCLQSIPTYHHAGSAGVIKLFIPLLLQNIEEKTLFIDVDTLFNCDIAELWQQFENFKSEQILGAAFEQQSCNRLCERVMNGPIPEEGVNSGVLLIYLERMRKLDWGQIVKDAFESYFAGSISLSTADQVIWNVIIEKHHQLYHNIPCEWNVQTFSPVSPACCPVVWPDRQPAEADCITRSNKERRSLERPNMAKLVHLDDSNKPGEEQGSYQADVAFRPGLRTLNQKELRTRFWNLYYLFRKLPINCFV